MSVAQIVSVVTNPVRRFWNYRVPSQRHMVKYYIFTALVLFGILYFYSSIAISITNSLDYRVFFIKSEIPHLKVGDYVTTRVVYPYGEVPEDLHIMKKIVCMQGQMLEADGRNYYCDGQFLGEAKDKTMSGKPVKTFVYSGAIPYGKVFLLGSNEYSFDSRYFGLVEVEKLEKLLSPLF